MGENGSAEAGETLSVDDKVEIVSECWVEPVDGTTAVNCAAELAHFTDSCYSRIPDVVSYFSRLLFYSISYFWTLFY